MNTNDPQASYGEPMLSVEKLVDEFCEVHPYHAQIYAKQTACWVRDFYENLITEGKLRVVEDPMSVQAAALSILNDGGSQYLLVTGDTARFLLFDKRGQQHSMFQEMAGFPLHELRVVEDCGCQEKFTRKLQTGI